MACCLIAAFLLAQFVAMLRRWGMFWGIVPIPAGEVVDTVFTRLGAWCARPEIKRAIALLIVIECGAVASWIYFGHGTHIAGVARQYGDSYAQLCSDAYRRVVSMDRQSIYPKTAS